MLDKQVCRFPVCRLASSSELSGAWVAFQELRARLLLPQPRDQSRRELHSAPVSSRNSIPLACRIDPNHRGYKSPQCCAHPECPEWSGLRGSACQIGNPATFASRGVLQPNPLELCDEPALRYFDTDDGEVNVTPHRLLPISGRHGRRHYRILQPCPGAGGCVDICWSVSAGS